MTDVVPGALVRYRSRGGDCWDATVTAVRDDGSLDLSVDMGGRNAPVSMRRIPFDRTPGCRRVAVATPRG